MGDLKHQTADELRGLIKWCVKTRTENEARWLELEARASRDLAEASQLRRDTHQKIGQKEVWARIHLAEKETATWKEKEYKK